MPDHDHAESLLTGPKLRARYGIADMTLWRWTNDRELEFPQPLKINRRNYWRLDDVERWERQRARASRSAA
jgi:predicted DNA-binding transcriptional regulator AlpA